MRMKQQLAHFVAKTEYGRLCLPLGARELLVCVDWMIRRQLAKFVRAEKVATELAERICKRLGAAIGIAEDQSTFFDKLLELVLVFRTKIQRLIAGNVQYRGVMKIGDASRRPVNPTMPHIGVTPSAGGKECSD